MEAEPAPTAPAEAPDSEATPVATADIGMAEAVERRCILTRMRAPRSALLRLVLSPDGYVVPDVAEKLPGRGAWVSLDAALMTSAADRGQMRAALVRAFKTPLSAAAVPDDLPVRISRLLQRRVMDRLGQVKRASAAVIGFDKVRRALASRPAGRGDLLLIAADSGADGRRKMLPQAGPATVVSSLDRDTLSVALGGSNVVHVLARASASTALLQADIIRYERFAQSPGSDPATASLATTLETDRQTL